MALKIDFIIQEIVLPDNLDLERVFNLGVQVHCKEFLWSQIHLLHNLIALVLAHHKVVHILLLWETSDWNMIP